MRDVPRIRTHVSVAAPDGPRVLFVQEDKPETREACARNPNHRVPVLEWPDGRTLAESNAILFHLAEGTRYLPSDPFRRAQVLEWMFFEQYSHEPYIPVVRFWHFSGQLDAHRAELPEKTERGYHALGVIEQRLGRRPFLVGDDYSIADIALYAYTHVAHEGGFDLSRFPAVRAWLERVRRVPGHVPITAEVGTPVPFPA
jgi:glutathione S-transferase